MRKIILPIFTFFLCVPFFCAPAFAAGEDTVRVGLYYNGTGSTGDALLSANLENHTGSGYTFGYYDADREFVPFGVTGETKLSMSRDVNLYVNADGSYTTSAVGGAPVIGCYHLQLDQTYQSYDLAAAAAAGLKGAYGAAFPVYDNGVFSVCVGSYTSQAAAESILHQRGLDAAVNSGTSYTVTVTRTGTNEILFEYDGGGKTYLGIEPRSVNGERPQTWFKGYRYYGGFEYDRSPALSEGMINVINVVDMEDYAKCVIPFEMSPSWPAEALKAQSVCARTYALYQHKHDGKQFDVCATTNCQVYRGASAATDATDAAVDSTAGLAMYHNGTVIEADYHASNGGATESSENVWVTAYPYLRGKQDPYEGTISIPNYEYEKTYTAAELTALLNQKGYTTIGRVTSVQPVYTAMGNIYSLTFGDGTGKRVTVTKERCRTLFSVRSMRFTVTADGTGPAAPQPAEPIAPGTPDGQGTGEFYINGQGTAVGSIKGAYTISGSGSVSRYDGDSVYVITAGGKDQMDAGPGGGAGENTSGNSGGASSFPVSGATVTGDTFVVKGAGSGHNVGMSQYGANAMARQGMSYRDILNFYYTGITIQ